MPATGDEAVRFDQFLSYVNDGDIGYENSNIVSIGNALDYKNGLYDYIIPDGYVRLEYIESDGSGQYINTGVKPNQDTRVVLDLQSSSNIGECHVFGSRVSLNSTFFACIITAQSQWRSDYGSSQITFDSSNRSGMIHIDKNKNVTTINGNTKTASYSNFNVNYPIYILAVNTSGSTTTFCSARILKCDIYDNGVLIRRFIPVKKKTGNLVGLYDLIEGLFYENPGNGEFIAGPEYVSRKRISNIPDEYTRLEYIKSDGTGQYINTGVIPNPVDTAIVMDAHLYTDVTDKHFMGSRLSMSSNEFCLMVTASKKWRSDYGSNQIQFSNLPQNGRYELAINGYSAKVGTELVSRLSSNFTLEYPIYLFAVNTAGSTGTFAPIILYSAQIYKSGNLVRNYIPAKRNSDSEIGLYDLVSSEFYTNSGLGSFVEGPENFIRSFPIKLKQLKELFYVKEYTYLEYIQLTGTQCIDTGFKPNQNTRVHTKIDIDSSQPSAVGDTVAIFGGRTNNTPIDSFTLWRLNSGNFRVDYGNIQKQISLWTTGSFGIDFNKNSITINSTIETLSSGTFKSSHNILIASTYTNTGSSNYEDSKNQDVRRFSGKIYWFKIYDNGVLVRDYVPAKRVADGIIGLYDRANDVFYENSGTGSFIGGPEV